jgi:hypothetical protein
MRALPRRVLGVLLALLLMGLLGACSTLRLGYQQLPRLASWWVGDYVDLDRRQQAQFDQAWAALQAWHRREELPRLAAMLGRAERALQAGTLDAAEMAQLEAAWTDSVHRTLAHAAPLAAPLLASFSPAQWQALEAAMARRQARWWREQQAPPERLRQAREKAYVKGLERWLDDLDRPQAAWARERAARWAVPEPASQRQRREQRQAQALAGLRHWAAGQSQAGVNDLMLALNLVPQARSADEQALRDTVVDDTLAVLARAEPAQRQRTLRRWAEWRGELQRLHREG